jgi:hypothetical protein
MNLPTWVDLRKLGNNKIVRSASVWTIVVPITAKLLESVTDVIDITILSHPFTFHLSLPFSWKIMFMTALAFMLANLLYEFFCPKLLKETSNYLDFSDQKRSAGELLQLLTKHVTAPNDKDKIMPWLNWLNTRNLALTSTTATYSNYVQGNDERVLSEIYSDTVHAVSQLHFFARVITVFLYSIGFLLLAYLMGQNIYYVVEHW